jgi:two-component system, cell cycle sensor histidine kinase and response regulator CckA
MHEGQHTARRLPALRLSTADWPLRVASRESAFERPNGAMARAMATLFIAGSVVGLLSLLLPAAPGRNAQAVLGASATALALAALPIVYGRRMPMPAYHLLMVIGTVLITDALYFEGRSTHVYAFLYLWVAIYAAWFLSLRANVAHVTLVGAAYAWLLYARADLTFTAWLIPISSVLLASALTHVLTARLELAVSEAGASERSARAIAERLESLIDAVPMAVIECDMQGRVQVWNSMAEQVFGWRAVDVLGEPYPCGFEIESPVPGAAPGNMNATARRADNTRIDVVLNTLTLADEHGEATGILMVAADVTERRELERQLRRTQKMEAIGRLAAGVAHDFNNILLAIRSYNWLLGECRDSTDPEYSHNVAQIEQAVQRASSLTRQLLAFGQPHVQRSEVIDMAAAVHSLEGLLRPLIPEDVRLQVNTPDRVAPVCADRDQIEQVILNLAVNARDAMPDGGLLTISVRVQEGMEQPLVELRVSDTGVGIDPAHERYIFEPFYTTKRDRGGTGFGLATVYGIVVATGGTLDVASQPGQGTTFTVRLPRADRYPAAAPALPPAQSGYGSETVLLVEDDDSVRAPLRKALDRYGYRVVTASDGEDALERFNAAAGAVDLVVTDIVMPHMSGPQLVDRLRDVNPEVRVLYVSGYPERSLELVNERSSEGFGGWALLQKPFTPDQLVREIRATLAAPAGDDRRAA